MGGAGTGGIASGNRPAVSDQKNTLDSRKRSRDQDQAKGGGPVNPQEVSTGRPTPRPTHKNAKSKPGAGNRGAYFLPAESRRQQIRKAGHVDKC